MNIAPRAGLKFWVSVDPSPAQHWVDETITVVLLSTFPPGPCVLLLGASPHLKTSASVKAPLINHSLSHIVSCLTYFPSRILNIYSNWKGIWIPHLPRTRSAAYSSLPINIPCVVNTKRLHIKFCHGGTGLPLLWRLCSLDTAIVGDAEPRLV